MWLSVGPQQRNMLVDSLTKEMDTDHLYKVLEDCIWCVTYSTNYVKQTSKPSKKKTPIAEDAALVGATLCRWRRSTEAAA